MIDYINTIDALGDDVVVDSIIERTITEFKDNTLTKIGNAAFASCTALTEIELPNVQKIPTEAFANCTALRKVYLPNVTEIGNQSLENCPVTDVYAPKLRNVGGSYAMRGWQLTRVTTDLFPELTVIGFGHFMDWTALRYFDLPNITNIQGHAFLNTKNLVALILRNENVMCTLSDTNAFAGSSVATGTGYIYVPSALYDQYAQATNWATYSAQLRKLEDYTVDGTVSGELDETKI